MKVRQPLLEPPDVAAYLKITEKTLAQWRWLRKGPTWTKVGGRVRYSMEDIDRWIRERQDGGDAA